MCTEEGRACRHGRDTVLIQDAPGAFAKAVAKALRHVRKQNWTEELSRRDYAVIGPLLLDGYADSQITDSMAPIIKCTDKTGMRQHVDHNFESTWTIISLSITAWIGAQAMRTGN